jgi:WD40 repeat protein
LAYLYSGSVWIMEKSTGNRRPLVSSGDLDGQVFAISPDGIWLLFTRKPQNPSTDIINTLWVVKTSGETPQILDLKVENIKNYAGWIPNETRTIAYTTVEPRSTAPGYQANNDLQTLTFTESGQVKPGPEIIGPNSGGIYGWWGTTFAWSPDGKQLAYARPDSVGLVDLKEGQFIPNLNLTPLQTHSDWAWMPTVNWAPDGKILLTVTHAPGTGQVAAEESPFFDLSAILLYGGPTVNLIPQSGMFAYPVASPVMTKTGYQVAYLQAIFPDQSNTSRYKLMVIDRDGSNHRVIFPPEGSPGVEPQQVVWAPQSSADSEVIIAITYQKNLWLINLNSGETYQMTGDSLITNIDWK